MPISIPILDRLTMRDYQSIALTIGILIVESFIRVIVIFLPGFVIERINVTIRWLFPWLYKDMAKPQVSPLEMAEDFERMVTLWGYPVEQHLVVTRDDYVLTAFRIPASKTDIDASPARAVNKLFKESSIDSRNPTTTLNNVDAILERLKSQRSDEGTEQGNDSVETTHGSQALKVIEGRSPRASHSPYPPGRASSNCKKPIVLLYHGFLMCSEVWVCNLKEYSNLPFLLAEQGYDVWLGNGRGNKYSQKHLRKTPREQAFWEFSLDEFALFDLPDTVDYILKTTGQESLTYIGFSQGTAQAFAGLSINPRLNEQINLFIALAPATTPKGLHNPLIDAAVRANPSIIYLILGRKTPLKMAIFWQSIITPPLYAKLIDASCKFLFGWTGENMSTAQKLVSYQHLYSLTSVKSLVHWFQIIRTSTFQMFDELPSRLPWITHSQSASHIPQRFPTKQIKTPIAIFYGGSDSLVDFSVLSADLPELIYVKEVKKWEHLDFLWAKNVERIVYPDIIYLLHHFNPGAKPSAPPTPSRPEDNGMSREQERAIEERYQSKRFVMQDKIQDLDSPLHTPGTHGEWRFGFFPRMISSGTPRPIE